MASKTVSGGAEPGLSVPTPRHERLTRRAWAMVLLLLVSYPVAYLVGTAAMAALEVPEGELLSTAGVVGWLAASGVLALMVLPAVAGVLIGRRAVRAGGRWPARAGVAVNAGLLVWLVLSALTQLVVGSR